MRRIVVSCYHLVDNLFLKHFVHMFYSGIKTGEYDSLLLLRFVCMQKLLGINRSVTWPVHFTSNILASRNIKRGSNANPGMMGGCFIEASNGIVFGSNVLIGPNVCIVSANHNADDYSKYDIDEPITIGSNVWIGANCVVVPGVAIGSNVIIGAGSVVTRDIEDNCIAAGNPCRRIKAKRPYLSPNDSESQE
jgi:serine acetyltransferase